MANKIGPVWKNIYLGDWVELKYTNNTLIGFVVGATSEMYNVYITSRKHEGEADTTRYVPHHMVYKLANEGYEDYLRFMIDDALRRHDKEDFLAYAMELRQRERKRAGK